MRRYLIGKIFQAFLTLVFVIAFNFFLFRVVPGDPAALLLRGTAAFNPDNVEQLREDLGLNEPLPGQFLDIREGHGDAELRRVVLRTGAPVTEVIADTDLADVAARGDVHDRIGRASG